MVDPGYSKKLGWPKISGHVVFSSRFTVYYSIFTSKFSFTYCFNHRGTPMVLTHVTKLHITYKFEIILIKFKRVTADANNKEHPVMAYRHTKMPLITLTGGLHH